MSSSSAGDGLAAVPPFDEDVEAAPAPAAVVDLRAAIADADAVLFATPEYNGSVPGQLKNALDWISRPYATNPLRNTPAAVVGASTGGFGAVWAQADRPADPRPDRRTRARHRACRDTRADTRCDESGNLIDDDVRHGLAGVVNELASHVHARELAAA